MTVSAPEGDDVVVRQAERADLLAILRIEKASFPQPWPYDAFEGFLGERGFLVAIEDDQVVGYVVSDVTPNHGRDIGHVKDIAVHPERRGDGVGSALLAHSLSVLAAQGATSVKLEVREGNAGARRLYRDFGFEGLRRIPGYYDDGEDAIIMVRSLE
ncbi:ribosomal protein S18-alanine N-acetyltransferase [Natribaculum luteum]|uniref:Ribosomal protein S18-alanine N-acetyltransferase n=1 Tax=Natribaculum luteum TaxID=1586232 RepID=A0ABD5P349_9EURY|nr:ribosomal protein S18-alanine N-acetyltransferase [Natribaculum luteum]